MDRYEHTKDGGFTLLEVVLVLVFISIFAAVAVSRQTPANVAAKASAEKLKAHMRYAQMRAMNTTTQWSIGYQKNTNHYKLINEQSQTAIALPGETQTEVDLNLDKVSIVQNDFKITFDDWGRPTSPDIAFNSDNEAIITLTSEGNDANVTLFQQTGFIQ